MMYPISSWDPFGQNSPFRMLERMLSQWEPGVFGGNGPFGQLTGGPAMDMQQTENELVMRVEVPGISPEDLDVNLEGNLLTVRGTWRGDPQREGTFQRTISLPPEADADKASASYHQGVLEVRIPKSEQRRGRQLKIELK